MSPPRLNRLWDRLCEHASAGVGGFTEIDAAGAAASVTLADVVGRADEVAGAIQAVGKQRSHAVIAAQNGIDFVMAFFASLRAGLAPVPVPYGLTPAQQSRLRGILTELESPLVLTTTSVERTVRPIAEEMSSAVLVTDGVTGAAPAAVDDGRQLAFVQYTSGSITRPRPVSVTCDNAFAVAEQAVTAYGDGVDAVAVTWVPLFHDMGLVTAVVRPVVNGYRSVLLRPEDFVARPRLWLEAIGRHGATHTSAPSFALDLCVQKVADRAGLDLSTLRVARVAGEHVSAAVVRRFVAAFADVGLDPRSVCPSYGLAEATLTVTSRRPDAVMATVEAERTALRRGRFRPCTGDDGGAVELVSLGPPMPGTTVTIVDAGWQPVPDDVIGEVAVAGPQVAAPMVVLGEVDHLLTGDFGFLHQGELFLVGRSAEKLSVRGETYYAFDIESVTADTTPEIRRGRVVVVLVHDEDTVLIGAEVRDDVASDRYAGICTAVRRAVAREVGITVSRIDLLAAGSYERTSSGKLRRVAATNALLDGDLAPVFSWCRSRS